MNLRTGTAIRRPAILAVFLSALAAALLLSAPGPAHGAGEPGKPSISNFDRLYLGLRVHWYAPTSTGDSPVTRYEVQYRETGAAAWTDGPWVGATRKATLTGLKAATEYEARVRAVNANGAGPWTDAYDKLQTRGASAMADPPDVTVTPRNGSLAVSWDPPAYLGSGGTAIAHYNVQYTPYDGSTYTYKNWTVGGSAAIAGNSVTITGLENGHDHLVRVRAWNGSANGPWSVDYHGIPKPHVPSLKVEELVTGLDIPWDLAFTPDGTMLFTEIKGVLSVRLANGTVRTVTADLDDVSASGEGGLMSIAVDPRFTSNRRFYTCQRRLKDTVRVVDVAAWTINADYTTATRVANPLVGNMPGSTPRHNGCRLRFGPSGHLWIATGDGAEGTNPQDLSSLGGKVLRVNASNGSGAPGNPFSSAPLIYTYGHRNVQGLARRPGTTQMWSVEHGPTVDDEVNLLTSGGNYGWDPVPGDDPDALAYNEGVPMTDRTKYPRAVAAKWSSGSSTLATSGGVFLEGKQWRDAEGRLAVATLKNRQLYLLDFNRAGTFQSIISVPELDNAYGRLRSPVMGPDGALYVTTSNGQSDTRSDKILKVTAVSPPAAPAAPTVAPGNASGTLAVSWAAPTDNGGGAVAAYRLRYSRDGTNWTVAPNPLPGLTGTITGLADNVAYQVQVRAMNAEGAGPWSQSGTGTTVRPPTVASAIDDVTIVHESGTKDVSLSGVFADPDNDALTITAASSNAAVATVSVAADFSKLTVSAQARGTATITATANDGTGGTVSDTFTVTVKAAPVVASGIADIANLATEVTREISLTGVFSDADGDSLAITAASSDDSKATVSVAADHSKLTIAGVSAGLATITVTAQDTDGNRASHLVGVLVVKSADASLRALSLSAGSIAPSFAATTYAYTLAVGNDVSSATVTATASHGGATLKAGLSGSLKAISSGTASGSISLPEGANDILVEVTAEDGITTRTYAIGVTRDAPALVAPAISFSSATYSGTEGDPITIELRLSPAQSEAFHFEVRPKSGGSARRDADYSLGQCFPGEASCDFGVGILQGVFPAGETAYSYQIRTEDDAKVEGSETFTLAIHHTHWANGVGDVPEAVITIADNDQAGVNVNTETLSVNEEASGTYTVNLTSEPSGYVRVIPVVANGWKVRVTPGLIDLGADGWNRPHAFSVYGERDYDAADETVVITHRIEAGYATEYRGVTAAPVTVSVTDKHSAGVLVTKTEVEAQVGSTAGYRVHLDADPSRIYAQQDSGYYEPTGSHTVLVTATSSDDDVATVSPASVTFTADAYDPQSFTVTGVSVGEASIRHSISGTDPDYTGGPIIIESVAVTVEAPQQQAQEPEDQPQQADPPKRAPAVAAPLADVSGLVAETTQEVSLSGVFNDPDGDSLTITAASSDEAVATVSVASDYSALTLAGVAEGKATITVTAQDADGNRVSDAFEVSVVELPGPVANLELTATSDSITVNWQAPETGSAVRNYIAHLKPQDGGKGALKRPKARKTTVTFKKLEAGQTYKVWVRAQNEAGKGERVHAAIATLSE